MSSSTRAITAEQLRLHTIANDNEIVIRCTGRLTSDVVDVFREEVKRVIPQTRRVVLDFTDLKHLDSSGLGAVVRAYVSAKTSHCELQLVNLNQRVRELLGMTNLLSVFGACGQYMTKMP
jgi:anti-anti-sigma factor